MIHEPLLDHTIRHPEAVKKAEEWVARNIHKDLEAVEMVAEPTTTEHLAQNSIKDDISIGSGDMCVTSDTNSSLEVGHLSSRKGSIRLSGPLEHDNIVNGYGLRAVLWTQGCLNHCPGCQNPETWDFAGGLLVSLDEVKSRLKSFKGQTGLTFCGGEPFMQPRACKEIADWVRSELGWNVWSFTGFTYELIQQEGGAKWDFLQSLDALIDGPFVLPERDLTMKFRGSRNQRLLHLEHGTGRILKIE